MMHLQSLHYALSFAAGTDSDAKVLEVAGKQPLFPTHVAVARALLELKAEYDKTNNQLHKADLRIGRLQAENRELRALNKKLEAPRFSPG